MAMCHRLWSLKQLLMSLTGNVNDLRLDYLFKSNWKKNFMAFFHISLYAAYLVRIDNPYRVFMELKTENKKKQRTIFSRSIHLSSVGINAAYLLNCVLHLARRLQYDARCYCRCCCCCCCSGGWIQWIIVHFSRYYTTIDIAMGFIWNSGTKIEPYSIIITNDFILRISTNSLVYFIKFFS